MAEEGDGSRNGGAAKHQKSYFDVLGLCCTSEVPLVEKILRSLEGVISVTVIVTSRTVIVVHDGALVSQTQIVSALNEARLEATVRAYGENRGVRHWPSPYTVACGVLLMVSFLKPVYRPLQWLAVAAVAAGLPPILLRAFAAIRRFTLDVNILMLIAVGGSIALRDYWEAATIVFLFTIAEWLESRASYKATAVMSALMSMAPQKAVLAETGEVVNAKDVEVNTILAVKAGELIPIDGVVVDGRSEVDEGTLTGESFPVPKHPLSQVWAGTLNINGYVAVRTTALAENSAVAKMTKLVEEAQNSRSRTQRIIDSCAKYYTPAVVLAAALVAVVPTAARADNVKHWLRMSLVLLVCACPCALVLSTPVATFCALTKAAKSGVLVKGGDILEALANTRVVAFDKTGTLTRGQFTVVEFRAIGKSPGMHSLLYCGSSQLLYLAGVSSVESKSSHPMAAALADYARFSSIEPRPENVKEFHMYPGEGIYGEIDGHQIYVGNQRIAARAGCAAVPEEVEMEMKGTTVGYVFSGGVPIGVFSLSDTCRTGAAEAVIGLKRMGIKTAMLTGDSKAAAMSAQNQMGDALDVVHAELLPEDKGSIVMVGDGMNDAPALAAADVGISMGISGSAIAMETSHVTLMSNDVRKILDAIRLGRRTRRKVAAIIALAFAGRPLLWAAILSDVGTCLLVIFNSMLLLNSSRRKKSRCCGSSHKMHSSRNGVHRHHAGGNYCSGVHGLATEAATPVGKCSGDGAHHHCRDEPCHTHSHGFLDDHRHHHNHHDGHHHHPDCQVSEDDGRKESHSISMSTVEGGRENCCAPTAARDLHHSHCSAKRGWRCTSRWTKGHGGASTPRATRPSCARRRATPITPAAISGSDQSAARATAAASTRAAARGIFAAWPAAAVAACHSSRRSSPSINQWHRLFPLRGGLLLPNVIANNGGHHV
ncbi:unnamed protein product [Spirodela intermedia]|uniref:HMA domain-containing protein n=1 Tax=Spirodela intermedia TaxID=51605 RepID=A0ABN7E828_SPIIN|nr:unnamed protein product [Spirodela intermedia]